jgi:hypothetical protein
MKIKYAQCLLRKRYSVKGIMTTKFQIAFIPSKFAIIGKVLKIKVRGKWSNGWVVNLLYQEFVLTEVDQINIQRKNRKSTLKE